MNRREFIKNSMAVTSSVVGTALFFPSCQRDLRTKWVVGRTGIMPPHLLDQDGYRILHYASLAPSGHNAQPWLVKIIDTNEWIIGSDSNRWLPVVDPENRETLLSIGAFVENLFQAASALGYRAEIDILTKNRFEKDVARVFLRRQPAKTISVQRMVSRRTVKTHMLSKELTAKDVNALSRLTGGRLFYFPKGSEHSDLMAEQAIENFKIQCENDDVMNELAHWTRLKDKEAIKTRDGLTTDGMEINGITGWYVRHFMDRKDVKSRSFRERGVAKTAKLVREGGGWLVLTSKSNSVENLIKAGRRFQRMALAARERMIAIHPMTQTLEEVHGQMTIRKNHDSGVIPQFMLRVGYLSKYPDPVTLRRPVEWFVHH